MPLFPRYTGPALMPQICGVENLTRAWRRVRSNIHVARRRYSAGPDDVSVRDFEADWTRQMAQLADELQSGTYRPLPARQVGIPKRSGGERAIAILAVRDRVAQRAVQQVLEPLFDPLFLDCSYGCRPLVGVPEAVARVARYAGQGLGWVVDADIAAYFDRIDHRILLGMLRQRVDEMAVLRLISLWLTAGVLRARDAEPEVRPSPLERGGDALRRALAWGSEAALPASDPYQADAWEASEGQMAETLWQPRRAGLESHLWTAAMMAKPVVAGVQHALPYVQKIGGKRLAAAGAIAAGAIAATEVAARMRRGGDRGAPQGGALSPLLANIYLHPFDVALTTQGLRLVRFMDDFVVMCGTQNEAERALELARRQVAALRLELNAEKTRVVAYGDGLEFLGQALAPRASGPVLAQSAATFAEAERALRDAAGTVRRRIGKKR
jgi:RNA-directed DNA polymerase